MEEEQIICCCHGWDRECLGVNYNSFTEYKLGRDINIYSKSVIYWWYGVDLSFHTREVPDGEPSPRFIIPKDLPFSVEKFSSKGIKITHRPKETPEAPQGEAEEEDDLENIDQYVGVRLRYIQEKYGLQSELLDDIEKEMKSFSLDCLHDPVLQGKLLKDL
jgi:hypothetical protein